MNTLLSRRLGGLLVAASLLSLGACKSDTPTGPTPTPLPLKAGPGGGTTAAHPAVVFSNAGSGDSKGNIDLMVMDSDGSHITSIWSGHYPSSGLHNMSWSPASSVVFDTSYDIVTVDVSVNSSGVPVGSNFTRVLHDTLIDAIGGGALERWSSTSLMNKIAFIDRDAQRHPHSSTTAYLRLISPDGSNQTLLHSFPPLFVKDTGWEQSVVAVAWSPDDSKIALALRGSAGKGNPWQSIVIVNSSTGAISDSIPLAANYGPTGMDWSRTGSTNKLLCGVSDNGTSNSTPTTYPSFYYLTPSAGSSPSNVNTGTNSWPVWSPNNANIMYVHWLWNSKYGQWMPSLVKGAAFSNTNSTLLSQFWNVTNNVAYEYFARLDWHR